MMDGKKELTAAGNLRQASIPTICEWLVKAWDQILSDLVLYSFKKCEISNKLDDPEDNLLYAVVVITKSATPLDISLMDEDDDIQLVNLSYWGCFRGHKHLRNRCIVVTK